LDYSSPCFTRASLGTVLVGIIGSKQPKRCMRHQDHWTSPTILICTDRNLIYSCLVLIQKYVVALVDLPAIDIIRCVGRAMLGDICWRKATTVVGEQNGVDGWIVLRKGKRLAERRMPFHHIPTNGTVLIPE
jgi:hypothetical protein